MNVSVKNRQNIAYAKKFKLGTLARNLASVTKIVTIANTYCMKSLVDDQVVVCDEIVDMPETTFVNANGKAYY